MEILVPPDSLIILGDRGLLSQLMANLLDNAIKYAPAQGYIKVSLLPGPEYVTLAIADSGAGIPIEERSKVFQRFYRLESSRSSPGNGLGLSLVAAVAALHSAPIRLSDNQPGLRVIIDFPRQHG
jgi:signal transduction histidine kinase